MFCGAFLMYYWDQEYIFCAVGLRDLNVAIRPSKEGKCFAMFCGAFLMYYWDQEYIFCAVGLRDLNVAIRPSKEGKPV